MSTKPRREPTPVLPPAKLQEVDYKLALYPVMLIVVDIGHSDDA